MEEFLGRTKICFGVDALQYLSKFAASRIFIVTDPFFVKSGMIEQVTKYLKTGQYQIFDKVIPDPPLELVVEGIQAMNEYKPELLLAVGGGSAIDEAKAMKYFQERIEQKEDITFIAVPTTSGTGSEVTSFAVITDADKGVKYPLVDQKLKPDIALLDPTLVKSVPPSIVADTGMDVLTHALEAYVSTKATPFTDALAEKVVATVFRYLIRSYEDAEDMEAKAMMHYASCMAGLAFDATSLGVNHALAHNIGARFHIPHGRTNAILLPHVLEFNADLTDYQQKDFHVAAKKYAYLAGLVGLGGANIRTDVKKFIFHIQKLQKQLHMPVTFRECGITMADYHREEEALVKGARADACILTNPRQVTEADIKKILKAAF